MNHVASLELSKELYELSAWMPLDADWYYTDPGVSRNLIDGLKKAASITEVCPKYNLGYLLRKLPADIKDTDGNRYRLRGGANGKGERFYFFFQYESLYDRDILWWNTSPFSKTSPEDAACKLAIELSNYLNKVY